MADTYTFTKRKEIDLTVAELKNKRASFEPFWRDVDQYICPGLYRGQISDANRGERKDERMLDSTPFQAWEDHKAGFLTHVTSPGQHWLRLKLNDPDKAEYGPIARWLDDLSLWTLSVYEETGYYEALDSFYGYRGGFGDGCLWTDRRPGKIIHTRSLPIGSYWVGMDEWNEINVIYREFETIVRSVVNRFGLKNVSTRVKTAYDRGRYNETVQVGHFVGPNAEWNPRYVSAKEKRFQSCYFELADPRGSSASERSFLSESGYDEFPADFCPWDSIGEDVWGYLCPGRTVLGDDKELQHDEEQIQMAVAEAVNPSTYGTAFWQQPSKRIGYLPGQYTAIPLEAMQAGGIKKVREFVPQILDMDKRSEAKRHRIERSFFVDRFRMLDYLEDRERTATEIQARQQEGMRGLIGATNRLNRRGLGPHAERTIRWGLAISPEQGGPPPMPEELLGQVIKIEFVSSMQSAMRALDIAPVERVLGVVAEISKYYPPIVDKVSPDQCIDEVAKAAGAPASIIVDDETVAQIRQARARQQVAAQQAESMATLARGAKDLGSIKTDERNALTDLAGAAAKGAA